MPIPDYSSTPFAALLSLSGRTAAVTGGGRGLGLAISRRLAEAGANVLVGDTDRSTADAAAAGIARDYGVMAQGFHLDVRYEDSVAAFADGAVSLAGSLDIWVNNAGIYPFDLVLDTSVEQWDQVSAVNLRGTFLGTREAAKRMLSSSSSTYPKVILNIASVSGLLGREGLAHYAASKHGVLGLTKSAARELGPQNIRVLAIAPTIVSTPGMADRRASAGDPGSANMEDRIALTLPLGRVGVPDDVARVALFCVSDMAALMTGSAVLVDAGSLSG